MKKLLFALTVFTALNSNVRAQEIFTPEVQKSFEETQAAMQKSVAEMDRQMQRVMPVVADSMAQMMQNIFKTVPPLMKSLEENRVLSKAAEQLNREIGSQTEELNNALRQTPEQPAEEKFVIAGSKNDNGKKIDFNFSQNEKALKELQKAFRLKSSPDNKETFSLTDLKNQKLRGSDFRLGVLNGQNYLIYDDGDAYCYITGIMNNDIIVRILATGEDAPARARSFILNSNQKFAPGV